VLDLDNTLWGGVIGDDGLEGIVLGQGSGNGEAFAEFQRYAKALGERGVILAVCSKNDEKNALEPFEKHPEMVLKRGDIACFVANWTDKASNLRQIAKTLNIGLDALVFADDNPVERALVRRELPMVAVPEMPEEPALYGQTIAAAGYFEGIQITEEDRLRGQLYQANA
jgi:FkbH-like protein